LDVSMAKKMTVIPTHLYQKLIKQDSDYDDRLKQQKNEILNWDLPPELRARMYQDVVRNLNERKSKEEAKPLLVKSAQDASVKKGEVNSYSVDTGTNKELVTKTKKDRVSGLKNRKSYVNTIMSTALRHGRKIFKKQNEEPEVVELATSEDEDSKTTQEVGKKKKIKRLPPPVFSPPHLRSRVELAKLKQLKKQKGKGKKNKTSKSGWIEFK
jgi:hypothetical protein